MNLQALMKQAQNLQNDMIKAKEELDKLVFEETNSNISLKANGKKEILEIKISKEIDLNEIDKELLEDIIIAGINNLFKKIDTETEKKLGRFSNSLPGLF